MVTPTEAFLEMISGPSADVDLARGALLLSSHANPELDIDQQLERIDELAAGCTEPTLDGVRRHLFADLGFTGDAANYYGPDNSFVDKVLDRRRGLPITLAVVMIEVGQRLNVPLDGVGMPGHFLVRDRVLDNVFIDPFASGAVIDHAGCERRFRAIVGDKAPFLDQYLAPVPPAAMLNRMAANLVNAYRRADDRRGLRWATELRSRCPEVEAGERIQLAQALAHSGAYDRAAAQYDLVVAALPGEDTERWEREAERQRARLN